MNKKLLTVVWVVSLLLLTFPLSYAGNLDSTKDIKHVKQRAPELIIHEEDLTYDRYKNSLKFLMEALDKYRKRKSKELGWEIENIGVHNWLLTVEGYGLKAQRDMARLELKNAKSSGAAKAMVTNLESKLKEADKRLKYFLEHNTWVD